MRVSIMLAAAALVAAPTVALSQGLTGAVTLGYGNTNVSNFSKNITTQTLDGRVGTSFSNGLSLGAGIDSVRGRASGLGGNITGTVVGVNGAYKLPSNILFGAYAEKATLNISSLSTNLSGTSVGVSAGYSLGGTKIDGFYGRTTTSPALPAGVHINDYGLRVTYSAGSKLMLGGNMMRTQFSASGNKMNADIFGVAAAYSITDQWAIFGGLMHSKIGIGIINAKATTMGLGVSYDLSSVVSFASTVSLEVSRTKTDLLGPNASSNTLRFGLTIPFGAAVGKVPMNSVADAVFLPTHSVISTAALAF